MKNAIIRIDDVGADLEKNGYMIHQLCKRRLRITCGVVPKWLTVECIDFLHSINDKYSGCLEIHQHGYSHEDHSRMGEDKHEFGPARLFHQQYDDIRRGREVLEQTFGPLFYPAFTPPFGFCDTNTDRALLEAGFVVKSAYMYSHNYGGISNIAPSIDCFKWDPIIEVPWDQIKMSWELQPPHVVHGLILHPRLMTQTTLTDYVSGIPSILQEDNTATFRDFAEG